MTARKGDAGIAWLRAGKWRLLRPHPLLGLTKSPNKGILRSAYNRLTADCLDPYHGHLLTVIAAWLLLELAHLGIFRRAQALPPPPSDPQTIVSN